MGIHTLGMCISIRVAKPNACCWVLSDRLTISFFGVLVFWIESIFLGMDCVISSDHLVCRAALLDIFGHTVGLDNMF